MQKRYHILVAAMFTTFGVAGCVLPVPLAVTSHVAGRVLDAATKRPLVGAALQFERYQDHPVYVTADGHFDLPEIQRVRPYPFPLPDLQLYATDLVVRAHGYQTRRLRYASYKSHLHETILLSRAK